MKIYRQCTPVERKKYAREVAGNTVFDGEKYWIVKNVGISTGEEKIELLAFNLGNKIANIAEVKLLSKEETEQIRKLLKDDFSNKMTYLVRLADSYSLESLPIEELEEAVAVELVFSLWIMRRDIHARNRVYVEDKIPVFFDHGTSFLREPTLSDIDKFFQDTGEGHGGNWRVVEKNDEFITTAQARKENIDFHYVDDIRKFERVLNGLKKEFKNKIPQNWPQLVRSSNLTHYPHNHPEEKIIEALKNNLDNIDERIEKMKKVIFQSTSYNDNDNDRNKNLKKEGL